MCGFVCVCVVWCARSVILCFCSFVCLFICLFVLGGMCIFVGLIDFVNRGVLTHVDEIRRYRNYHHYYVPLLPPFMGVRGGWGGWGGWDGWVVLFSLRIVYFSRQSLEKNEFP